MVRTALRQEEMIEYIYKTIMGTIPWSSSHSQQVTEVSCSVRLLLLWSAAFPDRDPVMQPLTFG